MFNNKSDLSKLVHITEIKDKLTHKLEKNNQQNWPMQKLKTNITDDSSYNYHPGRQINPQSFQAPINKCSSSNYHQTEFVYMQPNPIKIIEERNRIYRAFKESEKINNENAIINAVTLAQAELHKKACPKHLTPNLAVNYKKYQHFSNLVEDIAQGTSFSHLTILLGIFVQIAIALSNKVKIHVDDTWTETTACYIGVFSLPGTKKTNIINKLRMPFDTFYNYVNKDYIKDPKSRQQAKKILKKIEEEDFKVLYKTYKQLSQAEKKEFLNDICQKGSNMNHEFIKEYTILLDSCTISGLGNHLTNNNEQVGVITPEPDAFFALLLKNPEPSLFNKMFNQEAYVYSSGTRKVNLSSPTCSIFAMVQPLIAKKIYTNTRLCETGAAARILPCFDFVLSEQSVNQDLYKRNYSHYNFFCEKLQNLLSKYHLSTSTTCHKVTVSSEAEQLVKEYEHHLKHTIIPRSHLNSHSCLRKLHGYCVRFSLFINILLYEDYECKKSITSEAMMLAIEVCNDIIPHIDYAYNPVSLQAEENASKIITYLTNIDLKIDTLNKGYIESRTIQQGTRINSEEVKYALSVLERQGFLTVINTGRKSNIVVPHMQVLYPHIPIVDF